MRIRTITKAQLCDLFGLSSFNSKSPSRYYHRLRAEFFNEEALQAINMTPEEYENVRGGRPFTYQQTRRIIQYFQIEEEELADIGC